MSLPGAKNKAARGAISTASSVAQEAVGTYFNMLNAEDDFAAYYDLAYGSFKEHRKRQGAIFAAMDAFGEHEMTHFLEGRSALKKDMDLLNKKVDIVYDQGVGLLNGLIGFLPLETIAKNAEIKDFNLKNPGSGRAFGLAVTGAAIQTLGQEVLPSGGPSRERWTYTSTGNYRIINDSARPDGQPYSLIDGSTTEDYSEAAKRIERGLGGQKK